MNLSVSLWEHAIWIDFFERKKANWSDVENFCEKFNATLKFDERSYDSLHEEFLDYKSFHVEELPANALEEAFLPEKSNSEHQEYRMDIIWYHLRQLNHLWLQIFVSGFCLKLLAWYSCCLTQMLA